MGMFAHRLASRHWRVQKGVTGIREDGTVTTAMVIPLAAVVGGQQR